MSQKLKLNSPVGADPLILKWPIATSEGKEGPEEVVETIRLVCDDFPDLKVPLETRILVDGDNIAEYDYEETKGLVDRYNKAIDNIRQLIKGSPRQRAVSSQASARQLKHVLQMCYNHSVKDPEKLNHYEPFSPEVYGETSFELVEQMIKSVEFSEVDYFIDLGSGVGQVVLQVAAATKCKFCYGIEKADWPAQYAVGMEREFKRWMAWYGKGYQNYLIEKGDFLHSNVKEKLTQASIVFVNNFAFGPVVDHELKQRFANCLKEGARIVSSKAFCPLNFRISERNLSDIGTIMQVQELSPLCGAVSWTGKPFAYYVHTIDRTQLEKYFLRLKDPKQKDGEPRRDRRGRPLMSIKERMNGALHVSSNIEGKRKGRGCNEKEASVVRAAKVLDFDNTSNTSSTYTEDSTNSSTLYGPTTRRQWNEYVKRPHSHSGSESENLSSAAEGLITKQTKKKKLKLSKELNNGPLGKRKMRDKTISENPPRTRKNTKLRVRQRKTDKSSDNDEMESDRSKSAGEEVVSNPKQEPVSHQEDNVSSDSQPLDSLNLLHAHTVMSTSGQESGEKVNYNDKRMTESSNAYFKPSVQNQTLSSLDKEAGFLQMIDVMKQRFLTFLSFMQTPQYRAMLKFQIEQEKVKHQSLLRQKESLKKHISTLQKDGMVHMKERLKELGVKADNPKDLMTEARSIVSKSDQLKAKTSSLKNDIQALQAEQNKKLTSCYKKIVQLKNSEHLGKNGLPTNSGMEQERMLAGIKHLQGELHHLKVLNTRYTNGSSGSNHFELSPTESAIKQERKDEEPKEKSEMKERYEALDVILESIEKEIAQVLHGIKEKINLGTSRCVSENSLDMDVPKNIIQSAVPLTIKEMLERKNPSKQQLSLSSSSSSQSSFPSTSTSSSWKMGTTAEQLVTNPSPRILPLGTRIDLKKPLRANGIKHSNNSKQPHCQQQNPQPLLNGVNGKESDTNEPPNGYRINTSLRPNTYTDFEKSAAEDLISLKDSIQSPSPINSEMCHSVDVSKRSKTSVSRKQSVDCSKSVKDSGTEKCNKNGTIQPSTSTYNGSLISSSQSQPSTFLISSSSTSLPYSTKKHQGTRNNSHLSSLLQAAHPLQPAHPLQQNKRSHSSNKASSRSKGSSFQSHSIVPPKIRAIESQGAPPKEVSAQLTYITTHNLLPTSSPLPHIASHSGTNGLVSVMAPLDTVPSAQQHNYTSIGMASSPLSPAATANGTQTSILKLLSKNPQFIIAPPKQGSNGSIMPTNNSSTISSNNSTFSHHPGNPPLSTTTYHGSSSKGVKVLASQEQQPMISRIQPQTANDGKASCNLLSGNHKSLVSGMVDDIEVNLIEKGIAEINCDRNHEESASCLPWSQTTSAFSLMDSPKEMAQKPPDQDQIKLQACSTKDAACNLKKSQECLAKGAAHDNKKDIEIKIPASENCTITVNETIIDCSAEKPRKSDSSKNDKVKGVKSKNLCDSESTRSKHSKKTSCNSNILEKGKRVAKERNSRSVNDYKNIDSTDRNKSGKKHTRSVEMHQESKCGSRSKRSTNHEKDKMMTNDKCKQETDEMKNSTIRKKIKSRSTAAAKKISCNAQNNSLIEPEEKMKTASEGHIPKPKGNQELRGGNNLRDEVMEKLKSKVRYNEEVRKTKLPKGKEKASSKSQRGSNNDRNNENCSQTKINRRDKKIQDGGPNKISRAASPGPPKLEPAISPPLFSQSDHVVTSSKLDASVPSNKEEQSLRSSKRKDHSNSQCKAMDIGDKQGEMSSHRHSRLEKYKKKTNVKKSSEDRMERSKKESGSNELKTSNGVITVDQQKQLQTTAKEHENLQIVSSSEVSQKDINELGTNLKVDCDMKTEQCADLQCVVDTKVSKETKTCLGSIKKEENNADPKVAEKSLPRNKEFSNDQLDNGCSDAPSSLTTHVEERSSCNEKPSQSYISIDSDQSPLFAPPPESSLDNAVSSVLREKASSKQTEDLCPGLFKNSLGVEKEPKTNLMNSDLKSFRSDTEVSEFSGPRTSVRSRSSSSSSSCSSMSSSSTNSSDHSRGRKRQRHREKQRSTTPPKRLSSVRQFITSPPGTGMQYSQMPSPDMKKNGYPWLNHSITTVELTKPLSISVQQSPGYKMIISDSLRSPKELVDRAFPRSADIEVQRTQVSQISPSIPSQRVAENVSTISQRLKCTQRSLSNPEPSFGMREANSRRLADTNGVQIKDINANNLSFASSNFPKRTLSQETTKLLSPDSSTSVLPQNMSSPDCKEIISSKAAQKAKSPSTLTKKQPSKRKRKSLQNDNVFTTRSTKSDTPQFKSNASGRSNISRQQQCPPPPPHHHPLILGHNHKSRHLPTTVQHNLQPQHHHQYNTQYPSSMQTPSSYPHSYSAWDSPAPPPPHRQPPYHSHRHHHNHRHQQAQHPYYRPSGFYEETITPDISGGLDSDSRGGGYHHHHHMRPGDTSESDVQWILLMPPNNQMGIGQNGITNNVISNYGNHNITIGGNNSINHTANSSTIAGNSDNYYTTPI